MNLDPAAIRPDVIALVPEEICRKYRILPVDRIENSLVLAMLDPSNVFAMDDVKFLTGLDVVPIASTAAAIADAFDRVAWPSYGQTEPGESAGSSRGDEDEEDPDQSADLEPSPDDSPVVRLVNGLLLDAIRSGASDIHITPGEAGVRVSYRSDGVLRLASTIPLNLRDALTSRLKIMAKLDIAEKRLPQDGRITLRHAGQTCDIRMATLPMVRGETITMRLERPDRRQRELPDLGLSEQMLDRLIQTLEQPSGLIIIAGPARSGRTTTAHAALRHLNDGTRAIFAAEDPVAEVIDGIAQVQIRENIGLDYASAARALLRHDPDAIFIGRLRDEETASLVAKCVTEGGLLVLTSITSSTAAEALAEFARLAGNGAAAAAAAELVICQQLKPKQGGGRTLQAQMLVCSGPVRKAVAADADAGEIARIATGAGLLLGT